MTKTRMPIADIRIGDRVRKDMGDLSALAASIREHGLLHPPAVKPDGTLIAGQRRILACQQLGMTEIDCRVIDVSDLLSAERDENEVRKDFTESEAIAIARSVEQQLQAASAARRSAGAKARWARERGQEVNVGESPTFTRHLSIHAAAVVGMGRKRYEQAKEVVEAAEADQEKFGDIVETMDATGNVRAAHTELRRRRDKLPARHPVLRNMRRRDANQDIERAITALKGLSHGMSQIDVAGLDHERVDEWGRELKSIVGTINMFIRSMKT